MFWDDVDLDPGLSENIQAGTKRFIQKLNGDGLPIWTKIFSEGEFVNIFDIECDNQGNILIVGSFYDVINFDLSAGPGILTSNGGEDAFIAKYDPSGNLIWVKSFGSSYIHDFISKMVIDQNGNLILCGEFKETCDFDPGLGSYFLSSLNVDAFILKLTENGHFIWVNHLKSTNSISPYDIATDASNNIELVGRFIDTTFFQTGSYVVSDQNLPEGFVMKISEAGQYLWMNHFATEIRVIKCDADQNILIGGYFDGLESFGSMPTDTLSTHWVAGFVQKLDQNGNNLWVKPIHSTSCIVFRDLSFNSNQDLVLSGSFIGPTDFNTDPQLEHIIYPISENIPDGFGAFLLKLTNEGDLLWVKNLIAANSVNINSSELDLFDNIYASGEFYIECNFGEGYNFIQSAGNGSGFLLKIGNMASIAEKGDQFEGFIYPNPTGDFLSFENVVLDAEAIFFNESGQIISRRNIEGSFFDLRDLSPGKYIVQIGNQKFDLIKF
jgi:hypothetical protein